MRPRFGRLLAAVSAILMVFIVGVPTLAKADESPDTGASVQVYGVLKESGELEVTEEITFENPPSAITQDIFTVEDAEGIDDASYVYELSNINVKIGEQEVSADVNEEETKTSIKVDTSGSKGQKVVISYTVVGAARSNPKVAGRDEVTTVKWPFVQGFDFPIEEVKGQITVPGDTLRIQCDAGYPGLLQACDMWQSGTFENPEPSFSHENLAANEVILLSFDLPTAQVAVNETIDEHWTLDRAFTLTGWPLAASLIALVVGGLGVYLLSRRGTRDATGTGQPTVIAGFNPVGDGESEFEVYADIRPGEVGTVADEHVDPVDITATILDLAVRGHLKIVQLPCESANQPIDWTFERVESKSGDELRPYEQTLLDAVAPVGAEPVKVSTMGGPVASVIPQVQSELYDEVVERGWFESRPDSTRNTWRTVGFICVAVALVALAGLVAFTRFGLLGLSLVAVAMGVLWTSQEMPRRTQAGSDLLHGLGILAGQLAVQPTDQMPKGREYDELSKVLPFVVVLGGRDHWTGAFAQADDDPGVADPDDLSWYQAPDDWHLQDFSACIDTFIISVEGRLYDRD